VRNAPSITVTGAAARVYSVGEFSKRLQGVFRRVPAFSYLGVRGEVSESVPRQNGLYFTLKDADAVLQCFAYHNRALKFPDLTLGSAIVAFGSIRVAQWRSRYELLVDSVELTGIGELYRQYQELKERFRRLGFFEPDRKLPIPPFPRVVALISARGKGAEDFLTTLQDRAPQVRVKFIETRVQGVGAEVEIAEKLDRAALLHPDVIVLARGGGSYEDLFPFNREAVVRAIERARTPVITGIGHTADHHLADDVADFVCETPSNAAQYIASLWQRGGERLSRLTFQLDREMIDLLTAATERADDSSEMLVRGWDRAASQRRERLGSLERKLLERNPALQVAGRAQRLTQLSSALRAWPQLAVARWRHAGDSRSERMKVLRERFLSHRNNELALMASRLFSLDPRKPLERGYAIVTFAGHPVRIAREMKPGDELGVKLFQGSLSACVESVSDDE
jgi:exodeoxyribonuclease VII large subunit